MQKYTYIVAMLRGSIVATPDQSQQGRQFIQLMANIMGHKVHGWDDWIAVTPHGQEWIATPGGTAPQEGKLYPRWDGTGKEAMYLAIVSKRIEGVVDAKLEKVSGQPPGSIARHRDPVREQEQQRRLREQLFLHW